MKNFKIAVIALVVGMVSISCSSDDDNNDGCMQGNRDVELDSSIMDSADRTQT